MRRVHIDASTQYDVLIGEGLIDHAGELTAKAVKPCKCAIIADDTVDELYGDRVQISFKYSGFDTVRYSFPAGEGSKHLQTLSDILEFLAQQHMTRSDMVVALGGGVTGDMAGFAAAVYARGIRFIQIPTTLLAAVDSSVGGKTAVDLKAGKNLAGAFHQPSLVVTDTDVIRELPAEQLACGAAEVIKYGVLYDEALFAALERGDWHGDMDAVIERCVEWKRDVVAEDEFDTGSRAFLNLGHTFGHAIEKCSGLRVTHGQGVAIGMLMAAASAGCDDDMVLRLARCVRANGLSTHCPYAAAALAEAALTDKKRAGDTITLVLPERIGKCYLKKIPVGGAGGWFERALERHGGAGAVNVIIHPGRLSGTVRVPASKSAAHRALIAAALADGLTTLHIDALNDDIEATMDCLMALGALIDCDERRGLLIVRPIEGAPGLRRTLAGLGGKAASHVDYSDTLELDCGESGSTLRFLLPVACALGAKARFVGRGRLPRRPNQALADALRAHGAAIDADTLPMNVAGGLRGACGRCRGTCPASTSPGCCSRCRCFRRTARSG